MTKLIYFADDEINIRELIEASFQQEGYSIRTFPDGDSLLAACDAHLPDLVILDIMMPGTDGLSVCSALRNAHSSLPIIIVSAKDSPYDRVTGLTLGSDDYLIKPFLPKELIARSQAIFRRAEMKEYTDIPSNDLTFGELHLATRRREAFLSGKPLVLSPTEFDFLVYLMKNQDRAVGRNEILQNLWQVGWQSDTRAADDMLKRLRRKLRDLNSPIRIETVWGFGFRLSKDGDSV